MGLSLQRPRRRACISHSTASYEANRRKNPTLTVFLANGYLNVSMLRVNETLADECHEFFKMSLKKCKHGERLKLRKPAAITQSRLL